MIESLPFTPSDEENFCLPRGEARWTYLHDGAAALLAGDLYDHLVVPGLSTRAEVSRSAGALVLDFVHRGGGASGGDLHGHGRRYSARPCPSTREARSVAPR